MSYATFCNSKHIPLLPSGGGCTKKMNSDNNTTNPTQEEQNREASKRLAQQGQWKTPPLPVFATGVGVVKPPTTTSGVAPGAPTPLTTTTTGDVLPTTPDEYARMLQEAYQRGAEAGARGQKPAATEPVAAAAPTQTTIPTTTTPGMPPPPTVQYMVPPAAAPQHRGVVHQSPVAHQGVPHQTVQQPIVHATNYATNQASPPNYSTGATMVSSTAAAAAKPNNRAVTQSKSMPDMASYQASLADVNDEEEKRKKRLARNRASARLRRLKKKNLVSIILSFTFYFCVF